MRDPRPLSERFDLTYVRRQPHIWWRICLVTYVLCGLAGLFVVGSLFRNDQRAYNAGELSRAHSMFQQDCAKCHASNPGNPFVLSVTDDACLSCHLATTHPDAHISMIKSPEHDSKMRLRPTPVASGCTTCHFEHQGLNHDIRRVENRACIVCHADLKANVKTVAKATTSSKIANNIRAFNTKDHVNWRVLTAGTIDTTPIKFGHALHLDPQTGSLPERLGKWVKAMGEAGVPEYRIPVTRQKGEMVMSCAACHEADENGRYMKPIVFEKHCLPCHDLGNRGGEKVPHGSAVVSFVERVGGKLAVNPSQEKQSASGEKPVARTGPRGPRIKEVVPATPEPVTFESRAAMLADVQLNMDAERKSLLDKIKPECIKCHGPTESLDKIVDPHIPQRWLTKSIFSHKAHPMIACTECHKIALSAKVEAGDLTKQNTVADLSPLGWTGSTKEIVLPDIVSCTKCHNPKSNVSFACVTCHVYHEGDAN